MQTGGDECLGATRNPKSVIAAHRHRLELVGKASGQLQHWLTRQGDGKRHPDDAALNMRIKDGLKLLLQCHCPVSLLCPGRRAVISLISSRPREMITRRASDQVYGACLCHSSAIPVVAQAGALAKREMLHCNPPCHRVSAALA